MMRFNLKLLQSLNLTFFGLEPWANPWYHQIGKYFISQL